MRSEELRKQFAFGELLLQLSTLPAGKAETTLCADRVGADHITL